MPDAITEWQKQLDRDLRAYADLAHSLGHRIQIKLHANGSGQLGDAQVNITVSAQAGNAAIRPATT